MADQEYNGWTNYPTWNVKLWLDNDEFHYRSLAEVIPTISDAPIPYTEVIRDRVNVIADFVEGYVSEAFEAPDTGMLADLYGWAMAQVNWQEIARAYADDYPYEGDDDDI